MADRRARAAALIDLDGTLIDSLPSLRAAYEDFLGRRGIEPSAAEFDRYNGPPLAEVVRGLAVDHGLDGEHEDLVAEYEGIVTGRHAEMVRAAPGAVELLAELRERGAAIAVVTSGTRAIARQALAQTGLEADHLIAAEDGGAGKPAPDPYLTALELTGADRNRSVAIEDSPSGVISATAAGVRCIALGAPDEQTRLRAWQVCESLEAARPAVAAVIDGGARVFAAARIELETGAYEDPAIAIDEEAAERAWAAAGERSPDLFDGELLGVVDWRVDGGVLRVAARLWRYRDLIAGREGARPPIRPLGVSAIACSPDGYLVGRRARDVTQYPGRWEFAGSGTLPGGVAPEDHVRTELAEETGIDPGSIRELAPIGMIEDLDDDCYDLCYRVELAELDPGSLRPSEYSELRVVPRAEAAELAAGGAVPTMTGLLSLTGGRQ